MDYLYINNKGKYEYNEKNATVLADWRMPVPDCWFSSNPGTGIKIYNVRR